MESLIVKYPPMTKTNIDTAIGISSNNGTKVLRSFNKSIEVSKIDSVALSTLSDADSSFPKALTTLIPPSNSSTSVVIFAWASWTRVEIVIAFAANLEAIERIKGILIKIMLPSNKLIFSNVALKMKSKTILAVASGAIPKDILT